MDRKNSEDQVFESVAELFSVLSTPIRLKIISAVCQGEKNVSELLAEIDTTQPNMSQHLSDALPQRRAGQAPRRHPDVLPAAERARGDAVPRGLHPGRDRARRRNRPSTPADRLLPAMHR